jgi:MFS family permease
VSAVSRFGVVALYRPPQDSEGVAGAAKLTMPPRGQLIPVLAAGLLWSSFNVGLILYFSFGPVTLVAHGLTRDHAAGVISVALWIAIVSIPAGGFFVQRLRRGPALVMVSFLLGAAALFLLPIVPLLGAVIVGLAIGPGPGAIMALPGRVLSAEHRMAALGIFYTVYYAITSAGPPIAGFIQDTVGYSATAVMVGALMFALCVPMALLFEWTVRAGDIR